MVEGVHSGEFTVHHVAGALSGGARLRSALEWQTLESPRFAVHFSEGQRNLALRVSRISEQVIDTIGELFDYMPEGTIHIVLSDSYDGANGSATVMPRNLIRLFLAAPVETTGLASYDEWLRIL